MREKFLFIGLVALFVAIVPLVYYLMFERGLSVSNLSQHVPEPPDGVTVQQVATEPSSVPMALSLTDLSGDVQITHGGDEWKSAEVGMLLADSDRIRTMLKAQATLSMPGVFSVRLDPESEFQVRSLAETTFRFLLAEGMISADVRDNPETLFEVAAADAIARTRGGRFQMFRNRSGMVALGTEKGSVDLEAAGKVVQVSEGFWTKVEPGKTPSDPIKIPKELFLKVRWPEHQALSATRLAFRGQTDAAARVLVEGVTVEVDPRGRFRKTVVLREGKNRIAVEAVDVGGNRSQVQSPELYVDTRGDPFHIRTSPKMWEKKQQ